MRLPLAALLLLAACSGSDTTTTGERATAPLQPTVRDSAGIEIAEHPADAFARAPLITMDTVPLLTYGGPDAEVELSKVRRSVLLRDGRLAFFAEGSVFIVGSDGQVAERIGRTGAGPGEFRFADLTLAAGDTVLANDYDNARVSRVVPGVGVVDSRPFNGVTSTRTLGVVAGLPGGSILLSTSAIGFPRAANGVVDVPASVARLDLGSDSIRVIDSFPGLQIRMQQSRADVVEYQGWPTARLAGDRIVTSDGYLARVRVLGLDGTLQRVIRLGVARRAVDRAMVERDIEAEIAEYRADGWGMPHSEPGDSLPIIAALRDRPLPDSLAAFDGLWVGTDDVIWLRDARYTVADSTWAYTAIRNDGTILGRLSGSGGDRIVGFGAGAVLVRDEDADGFVTFRVHRLNGLR